MTSSTNKGKPRYEEAIHELESIVEKMENNELGIDEMTSQLKRAQALITLCRDRLTKTDDEIKQILEPDH